MKTLSTLALVTTVVAMVGCSTDSPSDTSEDVYQDEQVCVPGRQVLCPCLGGPYGVQSCWPDGSRYGPCLCEDAGTGDVTGASDAVDDTTPVLDTLEGLDGEAVTVDIALDATPSDTLGPEDTARDTTEPPCGADGEACCAAGTACQAELSCVSGTCACVPDCADRCGGGADGCGGTCDAPCDADHVCVDKACLPCGALDEVCCASAQPCDAGAVCVVGTCRECNPGVYRCESSILQRCTDAGDWQTQVSCGDHGDCSVSAGACECDAGYAGAACDQCAAGYHGYPECAPDVGCPNDCSGNGSCNTASGFCSCDGGFVGDACSRCELGFAGYPSCAPITVSWAPKTPIPDWNGMTSRVTAAYHGRVHLFGGSSYLKHRIYDPASNTWAFASDFSLSVDEGAAGVVNDRLYAVGDGLFGSNYAMRWDQSADSWINLAANPHPRRDPAAGVIGGKLYIAGGFDSNQTAAEVFDPTAGPSGQWTSLADMPAGSGGSGLQSAIAYDGKLWAFVCNGTGGTRVYVYDPATGGWETKTSLSRSMYASTALLVGSTVWLLGGQESNTPKDSIYLYDPAHDVWDDGSTVALPERASFLGAQLVNGSIYLVGGLSPTTPGGSAVSNDHVWQGVLQ